MVFNFYDIESLKNVFTLCNFKPDENDIDVYYLSDDPRLTASDTFKEDLLERIHDKNKNFDGTITLHNLRFETANAHLAKTFGLSDAQYINNPKAKSVYPSEFRITCDTDPDYDEDKCPYFLGYNSYNYDTTMLAMFFHEVWNIGYTNGQQTVRFMPTTALQMREYNNELFEPQFKNNMPSRLTMVYDKATRTWSHPDYSDIRFRIRKNMLMSGRHLDVARFNEKQQHVGLKRLLGMLGFQILESDKLGTGCDTIQNEDQFYDLVAYNVSDVVNLKELFHHKTYYSSFTLKKGLLQTYPELIYDRIPNQYKPNITPETVRKDRLFIDSSSAQLATKALCPYDHLKDIPAVSYMYPSERRAKELGIKRVNVLEEAKKFFYSNFTQPEIRQQFDSIYNFYKSIEGKNFNDSKFYKTDYINTPLYQEPMSLAQIPKCNNCMHYYNADGTKSSCFVTFSTGGIHGAEFNVALFLADLADFEEKLNDLNYVKSLYPDPIELKKAKTVTMADGSERKATDFLKSGATNKSANYKDLESKRPILFKEKKGKKNNGLELNKKYVYTSADLTNHEDFTSYYPNMLRMLDAFFNEGLGYDRYAEIFDNKQKYGILMKDESLSEEERSRYKTLRGGVKLILNSASGAGDATFESSIRVNNLIISMRIIGQLFTWRIGQAQTLQGAKITSTNTDGLYSVLEATFNNEILAKESADIGVEIEPEPIYLISKDSNNRLEADPNTGEITGASGGTLACREKPDPEKSLAHPAIIDWAMSEYLLISALNYKGLSLSSPFNDQIGMNILRSAKDKFEPTHLLQMFQNVIASSTGSISYIFGSVDSNPGKPIILQHYNRVFIMKDKTPNTMHLYTATAKKITPATIKKRKRMNERAQQNDPLAMRVLNANGVMNVTSDKEAVIKKITGIKTSWYMRIENHSLYELSQNEIDEILDNLDYDKYLELLHDCYERNWRNHMPGDDITDIEDDDDSEVVILPEEAPLENSSNKEISQEPECQYQKIIINLNGQKPDKQTVDNLINGNYQITVIKTDGTEVKGDEAIKILKE